MQFAASLRTRLLEKGILDATAVGEAITGCERATDPRTVGLIPARISPD